MPVGLLRVGVGDQHAKSLRSLHRLKSPPLMRSSSRTGHTAKRTKLTDPANRARSLGVAPYAALLVAWSPRSQRAGCVATLRWPLFERMGGERPIHSDSNG